LAHFSLDKNRSPFGLSATKRLSNFFLSRINQRIVRDPAKEDMLRASVIFEIIENYLATNNPKWINVLKYFLVLNAQNQKKGVKKGTCLSGK